MHRSSFRIFALAAIVAINIFGSEAQEVKVGGLPELSDPYHERLAFSKDGRFLREIGSVNSAYMGQLSHVRAVTYVAATGDIRHVWNLASDTTLLSASSDGRKLVISVHRGQVGARVPVFLFDTESGRSQDVPPNWFDADDYLAWAEISGNGRLVSTYSESGPENSPVVVSVYNWRTKKLIARQSNGYPATGGSWGGVTEDGKIKFANGRTGSEIVDPKTGRVMVVLGVYSFRSQDGAWIVEFPNAEFLDAPNAPIIENGMSGRELGWLDLPMKDDPQSGRWRGAFCGTSERFFAASPGSASAYELPSGKRVASLPAETWQDKNQIDSTPAVACSSNGKRVAIRSGARLTLHDLP
jgi:hypothetical protein